MRALWLTAEVPDRSLSGGNIRQAHLLEALATAIPTDLIVMGTTSDPVVDLVASVIEVPPVGPRLHPTGPIRRRVFDLWTALTEREIAEVASTHAMRDAFLGVLKSGPAHDVVLVDHPAMAPLVRLRQTNRWMLTLQNLPSEQARQMVAIGPGARQRWLFGRELIKARRLEHWAMESFDRVFVSSPDDAAALPGNAIVIPNGVDASRIVATPVPKDPEILLAANLAYRPNVDGAEWFVNEVMPSVVASVPSARLVLAGRNPVAQLQELDRLPHVEVHANPPTMLEFLHRCRVAVVPLRIGSGTRLKALEAMAAGRPVVGTSIGLAGLGVSNGEQALVADDPQAFAAFVIQVLTDDGLATRLARAGRSLVDGGFGWDAIGKHFVREVTET